MTTNFTASNGITVTLEPNAYGQDHMRQLVTSGGKPGHTFPVAYHEDQIQALREYFQHERDTELGRWRDEETGLLVYPAGEIHDRYYQHRAVHVLDEELVTTRLIHEGDIESRLLKKQEEVQAAARYFAAHPEPAPEWHDAAENDIWLLDGADHPGTLKPYQTVIDTDGETVQGPRFFPAYRTEWTPGAYPNEFTTGRRIWPEGQSDE